MNTKNTLIFVVCVFGALFLWNLHTNKEKSGNFPVKLFFYKASLDSGAGGPNCTKKGLIGVNRTVFNSNTDNQVRDTIELLLSGTISAEEKNDGITTEFPLEGVKLTNFSLKDSVLTLTFSDPMNKTSGGSCRTGILRAQIEETAKQFRTVREVKILPSDLFQP